jgi:two-component system, OmpR family, KDP operon response regulator KdpE
LALKIRLQRNGFAVLEADNIARAANVVASGSPELIVLDLGLPDGDGYTFLQNLKSSSTSSSIPVIVLTARDPQGNQERSYDGGAVDFFQKPVSHKWLLISIEKALADLNSRKASPKEL